MHNGLQYLSNYSLLNYDNSINMCYRSALCNKYSTNIGNLMKNKLLAFYFTFKSKTIKSYINNM